MDVIKVDDSNIQVTDIIPSVVVSKTYNYYFLKQQLIDIKAQKDRDNNQRDIEIAEVTNLIIEAEKLGFGKKDG